MKICPTCGTQLDDYVVYCPTCGAPKNVGEFCSNCGTR